MSNKLQLRRDTAANWEAANPVLAQGEIGLILDNNGKVLGQKIGDGVTEWKALPYEVNTSHIVLEREPKNYIALSESSVLVQQYADGLVIGNDNISISASGNGYLLVEVGRLDLNKNYTVKGKCTMGNNGALFINKFTTASDYHNDSTQVTIQNGEFEFSFDNEKGRCGIYLTYKWNTGNIVLTDLSVKETGASAQRLINPELLIDIEGEIETIKKSNITSENSLTLVDEFYTAYDTRDCIAKIGKDTITLSHTTAGTGWFGLYFVCRKMGENTILFNASNTGSLYLHASSASGTAIIENKNVVIGENSITFKTIEQVNQIYYLYIKLAYNVDELQLSNLGLKQGESPIILNNTLVPVIHQDSIERKYRSSLHMLYVSDMGGDVDIFPDQFIITDVNHNDYYLGKLTDDSTFLIQGTRGRIRIAKNAKTARTFVNDKFGTSEVITIPISAAAGVTNPTQPKNILFLGDSYVANGYLHTYFYEYLTKNGLTNYNMIGRLDLDGLKYEAVGGRSWNDYTQNPATLPSNHTNYFWNTETNALDVRNYFQTYCDGETPDFIICNVGINHLLIAGYPSDMDSIEAMAKQFIDAIHAEYPECKFILNGCHRGLASDFYYYKQWRPWVVELGELYWKISQEESYKDFVLYCDIAPYFCAEYGLQLKERAKNMWTEDTEIYFGDKDDYKDYVHPSPMGYKMIAFADFNAFLNIVAG